MQMKAKKINFFIFSEHVTLSMNKFRLEALPVRALRAQLKLVSFMSHSFPLPPLFPCIKNRVGMRAKFDSLSLKAEAVLMSFNE
jgi:hypothetical protein